MQLRGIFSDAGRRRGVEMTAEYAYRPGSGTVRWQLWHETGGTRRTHIHAEVPESFEQMPASTMAALASSVLDKVRDPGVGAPEEVTEWLRAHLEELRAGGGYAAPPAASACTATRPGAGHAPCAGRRCRISDGSASGSRTRGETPCPGRSRGFSPSLPSLPAPVRGVVAVPGLLLRGLPTDRDPHSAFFNRTSVPHRDIIRRRSLRCSSLHRID